MLLNDADRTEALALAAGIRRELADLGGRLLLTLGQAPAVAVVIPTAHMAPVPGIDGLWWLQLPCAYPETASCTKIIVGGLAGSQSERVQVAPAVRLRLNEGVLLWWQESFGCDEAGQPLRRRVVAPADLHLAPNELHSFLVLEDYLAYSTFSPALT